MNVQEPEVTKPLKNFIERKKNWSIKTISKKFDSLVSFFKNTLKKKISIALGYACGVAGCNASDLLRSFQKLSSCHFNFSSKCRSGPRSPCKQLIVKGS